MIWSSTFEQKSKKRRQLGDIKISFTYLPCQLKDGRWVWWEYVKGVLVESRGRGRYWSYHEVVENPNL